MPTKRLSGKSLEVDVIRQRVLMGGGGGGGASYAYSYLAEDTALGDGSAYVNYVPMGSSATGRWAVIDPYTTECEIRKVSSIVGSSITFDSSLDYAHAQNDQIFFMDDCVINVRWFGASADGVTDDTTPIQRALDQIPQAAGDRGATLHFPRGNYYISSGISYDGFNLRMIGEGGHGYGSIPYGTTIISSDQAITMFSFGHGNSTIWGGPQIENICFADTSESGVVSGAIHLRGIANFRFSNLNFVNFQTGFCMYFDGGTSGVDVQYGMLDNIWTRNCKYVITTTGNVEDITVLGGFWQGSPSGLIAGSRAIHQTDYGSGRWHLYGVCINNWEYAISLAAMRYWNITDCVFEQTTVNKGSGTAIYLRGEGSIVSAGYGHRVTGCLFTAWDTAVNWGTGTVNGIMMGCGWSQCTTEYIDNGTNTYILNSTNTGVDNQIYQLAVGSFSELTISGGVVTVTGSYHTIETEAAAATDDLDTINGGGMGQIMVIRAADSTHTVVAKDATGNLQLAGDFSLTNALDTLTLIYNGASWLELARSDNGT